MTTRRLELMIPRALVLAVAGAAALAAGCGEDKTPDKGSVGPDAGAGGANDASPATAAGGPPKAVGLAVVSSDQEASAAISLVDLATGAVTRDACLSSGSKPPQLSAALTDDVALPSQPQGGNLLVVIDRKQGVIVWVDPKSCTVQRQMSVATGFFGNPHDIVDLGNKAYVLRYDARKPNFDEGSDILIIDPKGARAMDRIDLRPYATESADGKKVLPRPDHAVWHNGKVYVVLNNLDDGFKAGGPGRIVVIDPETDKVTGMIDLPMLKNCGALDVVSNAKEQALAVGCGGVFSEGPKQIDGSGVAYVSVDKSPPSVKVVAARDFGRPVSFMFVGALHESALYTVTNGDFMGPAKDAVWLFGAGGSAPKKIFDGSGSFVLSMFLDKVAKRLYIGEAADKMPKVHVFSLDDAGTATAAGTFVSSSSTGLPPRQVRAY